MTFAVCDLASWFSLFRSCSESGLVSTKWNGSLFTIAIRGCFLQSVMQLPTQLDVLSPYRYDQPSAKDDSLSMPWYASLANGPRVRSKRASADEHATLSKAPVYSGRSRSRLEGCLESYFFRFARPHTITMNLEQPSAEEDGLKQRLTCGSRYVIGQRDRVDTKIVHRPQQPRPCQPRHATDPGTHRWNIWS